MGDSARLGSQPMEADTSFRRVPVFWSQKGPTQVGSHAQVQAPSCSDDVPCAPHEGP